MTPKPVHHAAFAVLSVLALALVIAWVPAPREVGAGAAEAAGLGWQELLPPEGSVADAAGQANPAVDGRLVRMSGYVVPLDRTAAGVREFLLVPNFGACVHVPPPPPNQIVLVRLPQPSPQWRTMDAVWVQGTLRIRAADSGIAASRYAIDDGAVQPYP